VVQIKKDNAQCSVINISRILKERIYLKGLFVILLLFPVVFLLHAQKTNLLWVKQMAGIAASNARGLAIANDASGNVYTTINPLHKVVGMTTCDS